MLFTCWWLKIDKKSPIENGAYFTFNLHLFLATTKAEVSESYGNLIAGLGISKLQHTAVTCAAAFEGEVYYGHLQVALSEHLNLL